MFIPRIYSKGKDGCLYVSVIPRQSTRGGKSVVSKALAVLTKLLAQRGVLGLEGGVLSFQHRYPRSNSRITASNSA